MCMYLCTCMYVVGHICKVVFVKSNVSQAKISLKTCVRGIASEVLFLSQKIGIVSETGYLIMPVCMYIKSQ